MIPSEQTGGWLAERLASQGFAGQVALVVQDARTGEALHAERETEALPAASIIKLWLLVRGLWAAQTGQVPLGERLSVQAADRVPGSGVLHDLSAGLNPTWKDLLTLMVTVSDNTATNMVIGRLGLEGLQTWLAEGWPQTRLVGKLQLPTEERNEAQRRGERNQTSAHDAATLLARLYRGEWLDQAHTALALDILGRQQFRDILARHVPRDSAGEPLFRVLSKSGELTGVHHDAGLLLLPRPLSVALLSVNGTDPREHPDNRDVTLLAATIWPLLQELGGVFRGHSY
ncbi:serine hydrolase [Deinococcus altitudinis]|uniref:serine hydrolase n=1 Tax=Deinococcus altitudinis TaxID=468914 RepID=UPI0038921333